MSGVNKGVNNAIKNASDDGQLSVEMNTVTKTDDGQAKTLLFGAAQVLKPGFMDHVGSFAVHIYVSNLSREISFACQSHGDVVPENVASLAATDLALRMREYYNPEYKQHTRNNLDKR